MVIPREELDEMLRRADEQRRKLRRASRELIAFGTELLQKERSDRSR